MTPDPDSRSPADLATDPRYLEGAALFDHGEYFDAHEVWEDLWHDGPAADRRFVQSLIQAAVALYHWGRGNQAGAARLFGSGRKYMEPYRPRYHGLDVDTFWAQVESARERAASNALRIRAGDVQHDPKGDGCPAWCDLWPMCRVGRA